jgi:hypothetical protein
MGVLGVLGLDGKALVDLLLQGSALGVAIVLSRMDGGSRRLVFFLRDS